jgi:competence ComEA-like helix-hairpin-helix protein
VGNQQIKAETIRSTPYTKGVKHDMRKSLSIIAMALAILLTPLAAFADEAAPATSARGVVNINTADASQLAYLPGVGPKSAERIVAWRKENGPFRKASDLMQVKGIGDKTFATMSPYVVVDGKTTLTSKQQGPRRATKRAKSSPQAQ